MNVQVKVEGSKLVVESPYHPSFPPSAKELGGRWDGDKRVWTFDPRDEERVRALCIEVYGTDGRPTDLVTIRHTITWDESRQRELYLYGRQAVRKLNRDQKPVLGDGVVVVEGSFPAVSGSRANPSLGGEGTVIEIRDVPRPATLLPGDEIVTAPQEMEPDEEVEAADLLRAAMDEARAALDEGRLTDAVNALNVALGKIKVAR